MPTVELVDLREETKLRKGMNLLLEQRIQERPVIGGWDVNDDIFTEANVDHFVVDGQRFPTSVAGLVIAFAVERFEIKIFDVGVSNCWYAAPHGGSPAAAPIAVQNESCWAMRYSL